MKIKSKFAIYNIIMLITPILLIGVISVCFVLIFIELNEIQINGGEYIKTINA